MLMMSDSVPEKLSVVKKYDDVRFRQRKFIKGKKV
jgi:hypothetical protein